MVVGSVVGNRECARRYIDNNVGGANKACNTKLVSRVVAAACLQIGQGLGSDVLFS